MLEIGDISPNPWQPRRVFNEEKLQRLAGSISASELIQPIAVRKSVSNTDTRDIAKGGVSITDTHYEIIAGERRWRAHKLLGKAIIKAVVMDASDADMRTLALVENYDREDLTDYEFALGARNSEADHDSKTDLAAALGINRTELYQYMSFFKLPEFIINDLDVDPTLLGRNAAEEIASSLKKHGEDAVSTLETLWSRVKSGDLDQGKIAAMIEATVTKGTKVTTERDIKKLFVSGQQAGSITRDSSNLTVKIRTVALTPEKEVELRAFVEKMFS
jgi:ParB family chromosome partitioning protein